MKVSPKVCSTDWTNLQLCAKCRPGADDGDMRCNAGQSSIAGSSFDLSQEFL